MERQQIGEIINLLRAKDGLIYALTYEENEFIREVCSAILRVNRSNLEFKIPGNIYVYSRTRGMYKIDISDPLNYDPSKVEQSVKNHMQALQFIEDYQANNSNKSQASIMDQVRGTSSHREEEKNSIPTIFIMKDMHMFFSDKDFIRKLRDLKEEYNCNRTKSIYCPIIITSPVLELPPELEKIFTLFEFSLMNKSEVKENLRGIIHATMYGEDREKIEDHLEKVTNSCVGLTQREVDRAIAHSMAKNNKKICAEDVYQEKLQIVKKSGVLDYITPEHNLDDLGGCYAFKEWIKRVKEAISPEAKEFGIPQPKGAMLVGVPGTSKTVSAEILASYLNVPLLNLDMAKVMGSFVGQSERQISNALRIAQAVAPCVLILDECEKVLGGYASSSQSDAGTLSRVMTQILTFLQKDNTGVITIMTSNDVSQLPPELTRTGRIDVQWMFDLPTEEERREIVDIYLRKYKLEADEDTVEFIVENTTNFTGAEIKSAVKDMLINSYYRQKQETLDSFQKCVIIEDANTAINNTVTVYKSSKEKIDAFRTFAQSRYLNASRKESKIASSVTTKRKNTPSAFSFVPNKKKD